MWRAPDAVLHPLPEARWPTAAEARASRWFSPVTLGPVTLAARTWIPAMVPWRATEEGEVTREVVDWYARFAEGQPGGLVVEATGVRDVPSGPLLRIGDDRFLPGLERLVEAVRRASGGKTRLFIQLIDFLAVKRRPRPEVFFQRHLQVSSAHRRAMERLAARGELALPGPVPDEEGALREVLASLPRSALVEVLSPRELEALERGYRERVTDTHLPWIADLPRTLPPLFASGARRAEQAGFDGVELHAAHAYTLASFLSRTNTREDGYGGDLASRARLPLEVLAATRESTSRGFAIGARILTEECIPGGSTVQDATAHALALARGGLDYLSLSRGGKFDDARQPAVGEAVYPYTGRSGWECMPTVRGDARGPFGRNLEAARQVRAALRADGQRLPVIAGGGISTFQQAEEALASGAADVVFLARQALADPDIFLKLLAGRGDTIRRCTFTNYCEGLDQKHKQVTCKLWDRLDLEQPGVPLARDGKRRLLPPRWSP